MSNMNAIGLAKLELAKRDAARRMLYPYIKYMFRKYYEIEFNDNWHFEYLCAVLTEVYLGNLRRVIINIPPSYGKTLTAVRMFVTWVLGQDPSKQFIYGTYGDELSTLVSGETRDIFMSAAYAELFPKSVINQAQNQKYHWTTTRGGRLFATSTSATITGIHCNFFILDDPLKQMDAISKAKRDEVQQFFEGSVLTRLKDKKNSAIIIIMQRLHEDDLVGRLLAENPDGWRVVSLKGIATEDEIHEIGKYRHERKADEALFPSYEDRVQLEQQKADMKLNFEIQYQQNPEISHFGFFEEEDFTNIKDFDLPEQNKAIMVDSAESKKKTSDDRAIVVCGISIDAWEREMEVVYDCWHGKWDLYEKCDHIIKAMMAYPGVPVLIEGAGGGISLETALKKEIAMRNAKLRKQGMPIITNSIIMYAPNNKMSKEQKISAIQTYYSSGQLKFRQVMEGSAQVKKELFRFNPNRTKNEDNCIDCIASFHMLNGVLVSAKRDAPNTNTSSSGRYGQKSKRTWRR